MARGESKKFKALYFDLKIKELKIHYSETDPTGAYRKIKSFLTKRNFSHAQYSGYHSNFKTTDLEIFDLIDEMNRSLPWLSNCVNHFEVTNVGANHDLMELFTEKIDEPEPISGELYTKNRIAKA